MLGFLAVGAVVYSVTAPPPDPGARQFSIAAVVDHVRRAVRGNLASTEVVRTETIPIEAATDEVRLEMYAQSLTVIGENRPDIETTVKIWSNGYDQAEAEQLIGETLLQHSGSGARISFGMTYPRGGRQTADVTLKVPARLAVAVKGFRRDLSIANAARVELVETSGDASVRNVRGRLSASHRGGELTVADSGAVKLSARGTDVRLSRIRGDVMVQAQGGSLKGAGLGGGIEIESNGSDVDLTELGAASGLVRVNATGGSVRLHDLGVDTRIDARGTDVEVTLARPAPLGIYGDGDGTIDVTPAPGGYTLDARATGGGRIELPDGGLDVTTEDETRQARGAIAGGGPQLTLRTARGEIVVHSRPAAPAADAEKR